MNRYRIKEIKCFSGRKVYEVQKRLLGFLWWYNFIDDACWETGIFDTLEEAENAIERNMYIDKVRIVKTYK